MQWSDIQFNPAEKTLRQFAGIALVLFGGLAVLEAAVRHRPALAIAYGAAALLIGLPGLVRPMLIKPVFVGWSVVAFPIGWLVSTTMLLTLYGLVFTPMALVFRMIGRDVLERRRPHTASYWKPKQMPRDKRAYFRQS